MKRALIALVALFMLIPAAGPAQTTNRTVFLPFLSKNYKYQFVKSGATVASKFYKTGSDTGTGWSTGNGAFGTLNNTSSPPCPLNDTAHIKTLWPSSRDLLIRRHLSIPAGARNVVIAVALDNAVRVYFNGKDVSGGEREHNSCATAEGDVIITVPDSLLRAGDNLLAVLGEWESSKNYLDLQVTGDVAYTIDASAG